MKNKIYISGIIAVVFLIAFISLSNQTINSEKTITADQSSSTIENTATTSILGTSTKSIPSDAKLLDVVKVVDGDTIDVSTDGKTERIRLIGINTPETVDPRKTVECFGKEASDKAKSILSGKKVYLEADITQGERDKYNRLLRYVFLEDGTNFNLQMIKDGYAYEYTYEVPYKYQLEFKNAQKYAQKNLNGLWSPNTCNGDTTKTSTNATSSTSTQATTNQSNGVYYTSSYGSSKYYYPDSCSGWKTLTPKYLKSFNSLEELLKAYPTRTLSKQCQ
jgi:micrococcal nuclease